MFPLGVWTITIRRRTHLDLPRRQPGEARIEQLAAVVVVRGVGVTQPVDAATILSILDGSVDT